MKEEKEKSEVDSKEKLEEGQPIKVDWEPTEIDRFVYLYRVIFSQWYSVAEIFTKFFANHMPQAKCPHFNKLFNHKGGYHYFAFGEIIID